MWISIKGVYIFKVWTKPCFNLMHVNVCLLVILTRGCWTWSEPAQSSWSPAHPEKTPGLLKTKQGNEMSWRSSSQEQSSGQEEESDEGPQQALVVRNKKRWIEKYKRRSKRCSYLQGAPCSLQSETEKFKHLKFNQSSDEGKEEDHCSGEGSLMAYESRWIEKQDDGSCAENSAGVSNGKVILFQDGLITTVWL